MVQLLLELRNRKIKGKIFIFGIVRLTDANVWSSNLWCRWNLQSFWWGLGSNKWRFINCKVKFWKGTHKIIIRNLSYKQ